MDMVARKNRKPAHVVLEDMSKPSQWRLQHGSFEPRSFDADPDTGVVVGHHRAVDTLGMMLRNGTISQELYDTGVLFRALFRKAAIDRMMTTAFLRLPGQRVDHLSETSVHARIKVANAMDVLGGHDTAVGSCAWHVLGCETSVREWALRQGWSGRPIAPQNAQGMLVAALGVLAVHFGLLSRPRAA
jgi:hypothetical protein